MTLTMLRKTFIYSLMAVFLTTGLQAQVLAGMVATQQLAVQAEVEQQRDEVRTLLARDEMRTALLAYGVDSDAADARVDNLSSAELQQIHQQLAQLPAGADSGLGIVFGIIFIFIVLDLLGATDVFPRI
jgi:hypothetical protein